MEANHRLLDELADVLGRMLAEGLSQLPTGAASAALRVIGSKSGRISVAVLLPQLQVEFGLMAANGAIIPLFALASDSAKPISVQQVGPESDAVN